MIEHSPSAMRSEVFNRPKTSASGYMIWSLCLTCDHLKRTGGRSFQFPCDAAICPRVRGQIGADNQTPLHRVITHIGQPWHAGVHAVAEPIDSPHSADQDRANGDDEVIGQSRSQETADDLPAPSTISDVTPIWRGRAAAPQAHPAVAISRQTHHACAGSAKPGLPGGTGGRRRRHNQSAVRRSAQQPRLVGNRKWLSTITGRGSRPRTSRTVSNGSSASTVLIPTRMASWPPAGRA